MLQIIIGTDTNKRIQKRNSIFSELKCEIITLDDVAATIETLEGYIYPSLFSIEPSVVHGKFLLQKTPNINRELVKKFVSSPTFFILEEISIASPLLKILEKEGTIVHQHKLDTFTKVNTIFEITNVLTTKNKKDRWLAYQKSILEHSPEALIGILYWKLKQLIDKNPKNNDFKIIYQSLMQAQKSAWQKSTPLTLAIEKVILEI
jgi:hypothetical protein